MKTSVMMAGIALAAGSLQSAVFDDAIGWYCGGIDRNGNGFVDDGEVIDRRRAGVPDAASNQVVKNNADPTIAWTSETVACAYSGKTLPDQMCMQFNQKYSSGGSLVDQYGCLEIPLLGTGETNSDVISNSYFTIIIRFKADSESTTADGTVLTSPKFEYLLGVGDKSGTSDSRGLKVGIGRTSNRIQYSCPVSALNNWYYDTDTSCYLTNSTYATRGDAWCELVVKSYFEASSYSLAYTLYKPGCAVQSWKAGGRYCLPRTDLKIRLGGAYTRNDGTAWNKLGYQGKVHMLGVWNRVLTDTEIHEALSTLSYTGKDKSAAVFKLGYDNGGHDLFGGENTTPVSVSATDSYATSVPSNFVSGTKLTITSPLTVYQQGLAQLFRVHAAEDSAEGQFSLSVVGDSTTVVGTLDVAPGKSSVVLVPADLLSGDSAQFQLLCAAAGAGGIRLSTIELCGSWRLGLKDKSIKDFNGTRKRTFVFGVDDVPNTTGYFDIGNSKQAKFYFVLPDGTEKDFRYELKTSLYEGNLNPTLRVTVNGGDPVAECCWEAADRGENRDLVVKLDARKLVAGTNLIEFLNVGTNGVTKTGDTDWNWARPDYFSFVLKKKVCGSILIFR